MTDKELDDNHNYMKIGSVWHRVFIFSRFFIVIGRLKQIENHAKT